MYLMVRDLHEIESSTRLVLLGKKSSWNSSAKIVILQKPGSQTKMVPRVALVFQVDVPN